MMRDAQHVMAGLMLAYLIATALHSDPLDKWWCVFCRLKRFFNER